MAGVLSDPAFYRTLRLPDLTLVGVTGDAPAVDAGAEGGVCVRVRYEFSGDLDPLARRLLGGARLAWTQELRLRGGGGSVSFIADANPRLLHGRADFSLDPAGPGPDTAPSAAPGDRAALGDRARTDGDARTDGPFPATVRRLEGRLTVALPGIGGLVERRIVPGILGRLDVEAEAVREILSRA